MSKSISEQLESIAKNDELLEIARKAIEDELVYFRDNRLSFPSRRNGLVIREVNGDSSAMIRFGSEVAVRIGLNAIAEHLKTNDQK